MTPSAGSLLISPANVKELLSVALIETVKRDAELFVSDAGERTIASRLAFRLQQSFPSWIVDTDYNRMNERVPKRVELPEHCARYRNEDGRALVLPDVIIHKRGPAGPNLLVLELKKTTNPDRGECDLVRLHAFRNQLNYLFGARIVCETRRGHTPEMAVADWLQ